MRARLLGLFVLCSACVSPAEFTGTTERFTMHSDVVVDDFEISVHLPPHYDKRVAGLPWVVQLDGAVQGEPMAGIAESLDIEVVVVGVGYDDGFSPIRRRRDYTPTVDDRFLDSGGFDAFERFVLDDVLPRIEADYRVDPNDRTIAGHSLGGMATLLFAMRQDPDAPVFQRAIAASPALWWDAGTMLDRQTDHAANTQRWPLALFMSIGELEAIPLYGYYQGMKAQLEDADYESLDLATAEYERITHDSAWIPGYEEGLSHVFGR